MEHINLYNYMTAFFSFFELTDETEKENAFFTLEDLYYELSPREDEYCKSLTDSEISKPSASYLTIYFDWLRNPHGDNMDYRNRMETIWLTLSREEREFCEYVHVRRKELGL